MKLILRAFMASTSHVAVIRYWAMRELLTRHKRMQDAKAKRGKK